METYSSYRRPNDPVQNLSMFALAWDECIELQVNPKDIWVGRSLLSLQGVARWEIGVHHAGEIVGGLVIANEAWDVHCGNCMSVFAQYVLPEYRLRGVSPRLMREALNIAREEQATTLAYTHRKGPWRYATMYRRLK